MLNTSEATNGEEEIKENIKEQIKNKFTLKIVEEKEKITNDWSLEKVASQYTPPTWEKVFENSKYELKDISDILEEDRKINGPRIPDNCDLFRVFNLTPLQRVKVVILGQDPYFQRQANGKPVATGLAFSVPRGLPIPSSLQNIYKELKTDIPQFKIPNHGDLTNWSLQGVFLLNACLTVREGEPGCFKELFSGFIKKVIHAILEANPKCIFVAWGKNAEKIISKFVGERTKVLISAHPSSLSANRGFFGCKHFSQINELLISQKLEPINWQI